jgi:phosphopantothenoylcysteine decarboxylase/phosphopantothenate--cysteine ligase
MGSALAAAAIEAGHDVLVVSGPVDVDYPDRAQVVPVVSTEEMLEACLELFPACDGLIGVAAPSDYRPMKVEMRKIRRTGEPLKVHLVETPDVVALMGAIKTAQWMVAFALETEDERMRALQKLERKSCDLVVVNGPGSMHALETDVEVIDPAGNVLTAASGGKIEVAKKVFQVIESRLIRG